MSLGERRVVEVPEGVEVSLDGLLVRVKGPLGELERDFSHMRDVFLEYDPENRQIIIWTNSHKRKQRALVGTLWAHLKNMIVGVTEGFTYKLKIVFSHFPMKVEVKGDRVYIYNFCGEKQPRVAKIVGNAKVKLVGKDDVYVTGINIEEVGQTAANIEQATKVKNKDPRVFLDGIYIYERKRGIE